MMLRSVWILGFVVLLAGCSTIDRRPPPAAIAGEHCTLYQSGLASWYGKELLGNRTANGEMFDPDGITAAHRTLPFGTKVKVFLDSPKGNPDGVTVRINDRGPFAHGRIIDLSWGAAKELNMMKTMPVRVYKCD